MAEDDDNMVEDFLATLRQPTPIPGWSWPNIVGGTKGIDGRGHGIYKMDDPRLQDPALHARCAAWLPSLLKDLRAKCKSLYLESSGNKKELALRLAIRGHSPPGFVASVATTPKINVGPISLGTEIKKQFNGILLQHLHETCVSIFLKLLERRK